MIITMVIIWISHFPCRFHSDTDGRNRFVVWAYHSFASVIGRDEWISHSASKTDYLRASESTDELSAMSCDHQDKVHTLTVGVFHRLLAEFEISALNDTNVET